MINIQSMFSDKMHVTRQNIKRILNKQILVNTNHETILKPPNTPKHPNTQWRCLGVPQWDVWGTGVTRRRKRGGRL